MRKFLSIFLAVAMLASLVAFPAMAAPTTEITDVPGPYTDAKVVTNKVVNITGAKKFQVVKADGSVDTAATWEINGAATLVKTEASGIATVTPTDAKPGDLAVLTATSETKTYNVAVQFGSVDKGELTALAIKAPDSTLMVEGDTLNLELDRTPSDNLDTVFWYSSNPSVIEVGSAGAAPKSKVTIEALKAGNATITVISSNGKTASITFTVIKGVAPTSVKFDKASYEIANTLNEEIDLTASVTPLNGKKLDLAFSPASGTFGTTGTFTIDAAGTLKITATDAGTGPWAVVLFAKISDPVLQDVAILTIKNMDAPSANYGTTIDNAPTNGKLAVGEKYQLTATLWDKDPALKVAKAVKDAKIEWISSNESVAKIDKKTGVVTAVAAGTVKFYATTDPATANVGETSIEVVKTLDVNYQMVKATTVKVRALPSSTSVELGKLDKGTLVDVVEVLGAWTKISIYGSQAYVATAALQSPADFTVTASSLAVRSVPGATAALETLKYGDTVKVLGKVADKPAWTQILYKNTVAYVASAYVQPGTLSAVTTGYKTTLNVRANASATAPVFANGLPVGTTVNVIGKSGNFYAIEFNGTTGYVYYTFLTFFN